MINEQMLNEEAMQIIMHAGDSRNLLNEAINAALSDASYKEVDEKVKQAKEQIVEAHKIQTAIIQRTIEEDEFPSTLLFSHAQDTVMTVYSELNMTEHIIKMYRGLSEKINEKSKE